MDRGMQNIVKKYTCILYRGRDVWHNKKCNEKRKSMWLNVHDLAMKET